MPLSKYLGRHTARILGKAVKKKPLTAAQKYERAVAGMEGKLGGRRKPKKPVTPLTPEQIRSAKAAKLREGLTPPGIKRLTEILEGKRKKD